MNLFKVVKITIISIFLVISFSYAEIVFYEETGNKKEQWDEINYKMIERSPLYAAAYNFVKDSKEKFVIVWGDKNLVGAICKSDAHYITNGCFAPKAMENNDVVYHAVVHLIDDNYAVNARTKERYRPNEFRSSVIFNEIFHAAQYSYSMEEDNYLDFDVKKGGYGSVNLELLETEADFAQIISQIGLHPVQSDMFEQIEPVKRWFEYFESNYISDTVDCDEWSKLLRDIANYRTSYEPTRGKSYIFDSEAIKRISWEKLKTFHFLYPKCGVICRCSIRSRKK